MTFLDSIKSFPKQLEYDPVIENAGSLKPYKRLIFIGMGGSALGPDLLRVLRPDLDVVIHRDYGLPSLTDKVLADSLIVLNSYSGNTAEVLEAFRQSLEKGLNFVCVSIGGKLLELAKTNNRPHIQMPDFKLEPRWALGLSLKAMFKIVGDEELLNQAKSLAESFDPMAFEDQGKEIANELKGFIPVIYSSRQNGPLSYVWKIKFNEAAKMPAFANVFPELNHNEMAELGNTTLTKKLGFVLLKDDNDGPEISKRMDVVSNMIADKGHKLKVVDLSGQGKLENLLRSLVLADWASYWTAKDLGAEPEDISIIEDFKKRI